VSLKTHTYIDELKVYTVMKYIDFVDNSIDVDSIHISLEKAKERSHKIENIFYEIRQHIVNI
jgi:hypothetical protein